MLSCKQATYLASKKLDSKLTLQERIALPLHHLLCRICRLYARDITRLHQYLFNTAQSGHAIIPASVKLSEPARQRIKQVLNIQTPSD